MKNFIWKHRIVFGLLVILSIQVPFIVFNLAAAEHRDTIGSIVETAHILLTSGLVGYLFSKTFESFLEKSLYGGLRRNWKEVRVIYSDGLMKGMGDAYPREPTLLIQAPAFEYSGVDTGGYAAVDPLFARRKDGSTDMITAPIMHGPMSISFNSGYVGQPDAGENTRVTGKWSELQLMRVGPSEIKLTRVGFPDTLTTLGGART